MKIKQKSRNIINCTGNNNNSNDNFGSIGYSIIK